MQKFNKVRHRKSDIFPVPHFIQTKMIIKQICNSLLQSFLILLFARFIMNFNA